MILALWIIGVGVVVVAVLACGFAGLVPIIGAGCARVCDDLDWFLGRATQPRNSERLPDVGAERTE